MKNLLYSDEPKFVSYQMKLFLLIFTVLFLFTNVSYSQTKYPTIEEIFAMPEENIDLGIACLVLAKDAYPNMKIETFDYLINYMADKINYLMQERTDPVLRVSMLNSYLYRPGWWNDSITFTYDLDDLEAAIRENQYLNAYISTKKGSCLTMPMLYLVLADRLGWPIKAVRAPRHFFCRYEGIEDNNIDPTVGGGYSSNEKYVKDFGITQKPIDQGVYLRTLTKKEYLASLLLNNARHFHEREKNLIKAIQYSYLALKYDSTLSSAHYNLGSYFYQYAKKLENEMNMQISAEEIVLNSQKRNQNNQVVNPNQQTQSLNDKITAEIIDKSVRLNPRTGSIDMNKIVFDHFTNPQKNMRPIPSNNSNLRTNYEQEVSLIQERYIPQINEAIVRAKWHRQKAEELGIVLKFPEKFFRLQQKDIEEFKKTGEY
jgi:regulator of sirC expression with transglutaminase-like and TPR domain